MRLSSAQAAPAAEVSPAAEAMSTAVTPPAQAVQGSPHSSDESAHGTQTCPELGGGQSNQPPQASQRAHTEQAQRSSAPGANLPHEGTQDAATASKKRPQVPQACQRGKKARVSIQLGSTAPAQQSWPAVEQQTSSRDSELRRAFGSGNNNAAERLHVQMPERSKHVCNPEAPEASVSHQRSPSSTDNSERANSERKANGSNFNPPKPSSNTAPVGAHKPPSLVQLSPGAVAAGRMALPQSLQHVPKSVKADRDMINTMNVSRRTSSRWGLLTWPACVLLPMACMWAWTSPLFRLPCSPLLYDESPVSAQTAKQF